MLKLGRNFVSTGYQLCPANECDALTNRHGIELPPVNMGKMRELRDFSNRLRPRVIPIEPMTWPQLIESVPRNRKKRVQQAALEVERDGLTELDRRVKAFIKYEKWENYKFEELLEKPMETTNPRMIQYRDSKFTYSLARYARPIEEIIWKRDANMKWLPKKKRTFAKGMTSWEVGANAWWKFNSIADCLIIEIDYSRMDAYLRWELREHTEVPLYERFNNSRKFRELMLAMKKNVVKSKGGLKWEILGTMMSGEYVTSLTDSVINEIILRAIFGEHAKYLICGDDAVVFIPRALYDPSMLDKFAGYGMKAKTNVHSDFSRLSFCQCSPVRVQGRWRMIRNPHRVMSRTAYTCKSYQGKAWLKLMAAIGVGELSCNDGVPILQSYAHMVWRSAGYGRNAKFEADYLDRRLDRVTTRLETVTNQSRLDFAMSFDIPIAEQLMLEELFDNTMLPCLLV